MLSSVEVITKRGMSIVLPLGDPVGGYLVKNITNLTPTRVNMVSTSFTGQSGETYQAGRREKRNPVMTIGLHPDFKTQSVSSLRNNLYKYLMPKSEVTLRFHLLDGRILDTIVRVESFDGDLFAKEPDLTISVVGHDPDIFDPVEIIIDGVTTSTSTRIPIEYVGTVDSGFIFEMHANRNMSGFTLYNQIDNTIDAMAFVGDIVVGDFIQISTIPGKKFAEVTRGAEIISALDNVSPYASWMRLDQGENLFRVFAEGVGVPYKIRYTTKHGGL